jgi:hypothetical protein
VTKRTEEKELYLAALRGDAKSQRACTNKGKPCGGRCIPANWNCRLKGEGETPPNRGGLVQRTPALENKLERFRRRRRNKNLLSGLTGFAALAGGAAAGAAAVNKGESATTVSQSASTIGGIASAVNPALTIPASLGAMGAAMGAFGARSRQQSNDRKVLQSKLSGISLRQKAIKTRISNKENERKIYEKDIDKANVVLLGAKTKVNKKGVYSDRDRRVAFAKLKVATRRLSTIDVQLKGMHRTSKRLSLEYVQNSKGLGDRSTGLQNAMSSLRAGTEAAKRTRSQRLSTRRNTGLTGQGKPGAKKNPVPWNLQKQNIEGYKRSDAVSAKGKKCGGSHISAIKKCRKGRGGSAIAAIATATAVGVIGVSAAKAIDDVVRVRSRQFGEPNFKPFKGQLGDVDKFQRANGKELASGAFGSTKLVKVGGGTYAVKTPKTPDKETRKSMGAGLDAKATRNLYRAQGRISNSEVANSRLAASLGLAPRVIAANKNALISEVAKGQPVKKLNKDQARELHNNLARLHRAGIAHNDLKSDNFFVDKSNKIQFIDFGLSQRSSSGVAREWYRAMNPSSPNPLLKATGTATGSFNLRQFNNAGYEAAEKAMKKVLKGEVSEDRIIKAGSNPATARQLQLIVNNYYEGKYNRVRNDAVGKKCGGGYISPAKKCTKGSQGNNARELAKGFAATALIAGGAAALSRVSLKRKTGSSKFGLSRYQKRQLKKSRLKGTGKYGTYAKRSTTAKQMPYYTEADRPVALKHKRLFRDAEAVDAEGKKYSKTVTDPKTGRKRTVKYGAKGYTIAPGTKRGNSYCARSFGDMKSHNKNCAGKDRNTPLCLSRAKWKCSGKNSRGA